MYTGDEEGVVTGELGGAAPDLEEVATHGVGWGGWEVGECLNVRERERGFEVGCSRTADECVMLLRTHVSMT